MKPVVSEAAMNDAFISLFGPLVYVKRDHSDLLADIDEVLVGMVREGPADCPRPVTADEVPIDPGILMRLPAAATSQFCGYQGKL